MTAAKSTPVVDLVLLGGDIGVYALARAFHEQYGTVATVVTRTVSGPVAAAQHEPASPSPMRPATSTAATSRSPT